jgi:hypothetical protein
MNRLGLASVLIAGLIALTATAWMTVWTPHYSVRGDLWTLAAGAALIGYLVGVVGSRREAEPASEAGRGLARQGRRLNGALIAVLVLAVAASGLIRARAPRLYSGVIGDVRAVLSAQARYEDETGAYGELHCLESPADCIEGYPSGAPVFLDASLASLHVKAQYERAFHLSRAMESSSPGDGAAGGATFAYLAVPSEPLREAGPYPGVCGDATGAICSTPDGTAPRVEGGLCVLTPGPAPRPGMHERLGVWAGLVAAPAPGACYLLGQ